MAREPDRARLREVFREFELRDPLRRLEEAMGDAEEAAPRERASEVVEAKAESRSRPPRSARLTGTLLTLAAERPLLDGEDGGNGATPAPGASPTGRPRRSWSSRWPRARPPRSEVEALDPELDAELTLAAEEPQAEPSPPAPSGDSAQLGLGDADGGLRSRDAQVRGLRRRRRGPGRRGRDAGRARAGAGATARSSPTTGSRSPAPRTRRSPRRSSTTRWSPPT